ncbi:efflux RND transporter permease subunit [Rhodopirellula sp. JC639]|uniref:efflux RND transporter permease subunit n=1 Tax=Stieleria mannarensis TaxID=2755585 RepID=UPI0015FED3AE|nr:MMPL family transporter [Rhodopirellula sp. JC639]
MPNPQQEQGLTDRPLLERRTPLGVSFALVVLFGFFFLMPFAFRSARLSLNKKENDIKDWLPAEFVETAELEWFADHFAGESFVIATWPGCTEDDQRLKLLESKLRHESSQSDPAEGIEDPKLSQDYRSAKEYGVRLGLLPASRSLNNWGGKNEKWLTTADGKWYYITPNGHLHRWEGRSNAPAGLVRGIKRSLGTHELQGTFVAAFGPEDGERANPFHNDPSLLTAPMFRSVETGVSLVKELSKEGGLLWPVDFTDQSRRPIVARRRAMERLTGSLFAPAVPNQFAWTAAAFRGVVPSEQRAAIPENFEAIVDKTLAEFADENLDGELERLATSETETQTDAWYAVFDAAGLTPPPRQTCLLITLTDIAQDNLAHALGRGVLGAPRGRLLELAHDSGIQPAAPPSMAPPPFNRTEVESLAGAPPLRLGGPPVDNIAIDEEGTVTLVRLVGYSILVGALLSYLCFGSFKITLMVFIVGGSAAMLSMAVVGWTNGSVDAILMSMPSLVYVLGLSGAIHVINYYRDEVRKSGRRGAAGRALQHAMFPCSLAALTTAIGLGSLYTSNLAPISNFGLYSAIGVIATLAILFSYLPAALQTFVTESHSEPETPSHERRDEDDEPKESWLSDRWADAGAWICRRHLLVTTGCMILLVAAAMGLPKIKTSVQLLKLFDENARIIRDYAWLESNFGKLVPMELVLRVPPSMQLETIAEAAADESDGLADVASADASDPETTSPDSALPLNVLERVEAVARVSSVVHRTLGEPGLDIVGSTTAVNTFLKPLPGVTNSWNPVRSQYISELNQGRDELLANDYVRLEKAGPYAGSELWRISLRVGALADVDYGQFIKTLRVSVEPVLRAYDTREELLDKIAAADAGGGKQPVIVMLGAPRPSPLAETELVDLSDKADLASEDRIRTRAIYLSVLEELLRGERLREPIWVDHLSTEKPIDIGGERWNKVIEIADVVVWVGEDPAPQAALADAKTLIDAQGIFAKAISHELIDDTIPEVAGSGAMQVVYTGVVPVVYKAQRTLLGSLVESIALAFVLISVVMVVLLNPARTPLRMLGPVSFGSGLGAGVVSMIPNMFPVLLVFGLMGHFGRLVDIGTMMTASVAMGVAVDDTIHFLSWFRSYLDRGFDRIKAVEMTYRRVGPAMTQTTIVGGLGLFVFALSTFTPTQRFGTLMLVLLVAALVGDLVLLPALLAGPFGKLFRPRVGSKGATGVSDDELALLQPDGDGPDGGSSQPAEDEPAAATLAIDKESLPSLKLHSPSRRTDRPHRMKGR